MESEMKGFLMNLDTAMKFYKRCGELKAVTLEERTKVLNDLIHEDDIKILPEKRLVQYLNGKKVMVGKGRTKDNGK